MAPNVIVLPSPAASPELDAARSELSTWHEINSIIMSGRMPPTEWQKAKAVLELLDKHTTAAQEKVAALTPPSVTDRISKAVIGDTGTPEFEDELLKIIRSRDEEPADAAIPDKGEASH